MNMISSPPAEPVLLPFLPLRDVVIFPHMVVPLFVGRTKSIKALELSSSANKHVLLVTQKESTHDEPSMEGLYELGCVGSVLQMLRLPDGTMKVLVEGNNRARLVRLGNARDVFSAEALILAPDGEVADEKTLCRVISGQFEQYLKYNKKIPQDVFSNIASLESLGRLVDNVVAQMPLPLVRKQEFLETVDIRQRSDMLLKTLEEEIDILQAEKRIRGRVKRQMEKNQRDYYLNEQVKAIQKELGDGAEYDEMDELAKSLKAAHLSKEAQEKADSELRKLKQMQPMSAEATVVRTYLETLAGLPWKKKTRIGRDIEASEAVLNKEHHGLEKVKERILEYLAVQTRTDRIKAPILCLVGPPGVGKTSLGQSIAHATGRKFVRMSLGGVRDEAEIRGHRRTYIGALPGKILQNLSKSGTRNPLFLLDEIDKMGMDFRGDPASALLEVLDPEQNSSFMDHYVEVEFDLSEVLFVATANSLNIPPPLLDRMEILRLSGYTEEEKVAIAMDHLVPKQIKANALKPTELNLKADVVRDIIRYYTRESGVRSLEREISKICRKTVRAVLKKKTKPAPITVDNLVDFLGVRKYTPGLAGKSPQVGQVSGLAWTETGGELLSVEAVIMPGTGKTVSTGKLGDVMKESTQAAMTVVRARALQYGLAADFHQKHDAHIHFPEGAVPKDGPSAGIAIVTALLSALTGRMVDHQVAMTGEITLRGEVLAIGGLKEKLLAAKRAGITTVLIPHDNQKDLKELSEEVTSGLTISPVQWIDQVLERALLPLASSVADEEANVPAAVPPVKKPRRRPSLNA